MEEHINEKLKKVRSQNNRLQQLHLTLGGLKHQLKRKVPLQRQQRALLNTKFNAYKRMQNISLTSLFFSIFGNKEEQLHKREKIYQAAKINFNKGEQEVKNLREQIQEIQKEIRQLGNIETKYEQLLVEKEAHILSEESARSSQFASILVKLKKAELTLQQAKKTHHHIIPVIERLDEILSKLNAALGWGRMDMIGGGMIVKSIKYAKIGTAEGMVRKLRSDIRAFAREAEKIDEALFLSHSIDIGKFMAIPNFIFDNLIMDFMVQGKIHNARNHIKSFKIEASKIENQLSNLIVKKEQDIDRLKSERLAFLH